ncbi:hypothetical protein [Lacinutrix mariniflava]|uniref:hypothetical protein n=1 Tax=Lacinutrix mariniflava TaxID=342955 RepID=UPI000A5F7627|nr:hypothetical protein [Lacinutrix mariniflava]
MYLFHKDRKDHLKGNVRYSIGTITNLNSGAKVSNSFRYAFYANNQFKKSI